MPDVIFEDSNYKIVANIKSGVFKTKYKGKLDLHYMYGDTEVKTETDIDVNNGKVEKNYLVPKVKDTDANYVLKIIANYGKNKEKTLILAEATVWPREAKWVLKDTEDKPVAGVRITITFGDNRQIFTDTNKDGVAVSNLSKTTYTYTVKAPWEIVTDKNDVKKREHQIVVRRNMQAKILKPDLTQKCYVPATEGGEKTAGVRQYVNAPLTDKNGCDADGSTIEFEVACKKLSDGLTNDKIYIKVEFSKISARTTPAPALLAPAEDIQTDNGGKEFTGFVKLPSDGGTAKFKLQLGYAGGETFKVSVGYSKGDPSDDTQTFVTWRKITYQQTPWASAGRLELKVMNFRVVDSIGRKNDGCPCISRQLRLLPLNRQRCSSLRPNFDDRVQL